MTDPERTPDVLDLGANLPSDSTLILRTFGRPELEALAWPLAELAHACGWRLLISADPELAWRTGADGVHWPERFLARACRPWPGALISTSAHSPSAIRKAQSVSDGILISPVFASNSPSAKHPKGVFRAAACLRRSSVPVYALGGINTRTVKRLQGLGFSGIGVVGALSAT